MERQCLNICGTLCATYVDGVIIESQELSVGIIEGLLHRQSNMRNYQSTVGGLEVNSIVGVLEMRIILANLHTFTIYIDYQSHYRSRR